MRLPDYVHLQGLGWAMLRQSACPVQRAICMQRKRRGECISNVTFAWRSA